MKVCQNCGAQNDDRNNFCGKCAAPMSAQPQAYGCPQPSVPRKMKKPLYKKWWFWVLIVVIVAAAASASRGGDDETTGTGDAKEPMAAINAASNTAEVSPPESTEAPIVIDAAELYTQYADNEVKADTLYKGKILQVTGVVNRVTVTLGTIQVILNDGKEFSWSDIYCHFKDDQSEAVADLNSGDTITIQGECTGKSLAPALTKCTIVD